MTLHKWGIITLYYLITIMAKEQAISIISPVAGDIWTYDYSTRIISGQIRWTSTQPTNSSVVISLWTDISGNFDKITNLTSGTGTQNNGVYNFQIVFPQPYGYSSYNNVYLQMTDDEARSVNFVIKSSNWCDNSPNCGDNEKCDFTSQSCVCASGYVRNPNSGKCLSNCQSIRCPLNSVCYSTDALCHCNLGYVFNADHTGCELPKTSPTSLNPATRNCELIKCPLNSACSSTNGVCYCNPGYVVNADRTGCMPTSPPPPSSNCERVTCPLNSACSSADGLCYCNPGYVLNTAQTGFILPSPPTSQPSESPNCKIVACPLNSTCSSADALCYCNPGFVVNDAGTLCVISSTPPSCTPQATALSGAELITIIVVAIVLVVVIGGMVILRFYPNWRDSQIAQFKQLQESHLGEEETVLDERKASLDSQDV